MLFYRSPAKINLSLDVLSRRPDGYHELQSVVHCIGLFDTIGIDTSSSSEFSLRCNDAGLSGEENLCLRAARAWRRAVKHSGDGRSYFPGLRITLDKKIPVGAGLGGGSGNAAATLLALNDHFGSPLEKEQLLEIAVALGADVPLFLEGGCMLMEGIGERLQTLPALTGWIVLIQPPQRVDTAQVYQRFDLLKGASARSTLEENPSKESTSEGSTLTSAVLEALQTQELAKVASVLGNDLQSAAQSLGIETELPVHLLKKHGALGAQMSGSGAAVFGLFSDAGAAQVASEHIRADADCPEGYQVFAAPLLASGVEALAARQTVG